MHTDSGVLHFIIFLNNKIVILFLCHLNFGANFPHQVLISTLSINFSIIFIILDENSKINIFQVSRRKQSLPIKNNSVNQRKSSQSSQHACSINLSFYIIPYLYSITTTVFHHFKSISVSEQKLKFNSHKFVQVNYFHSAHSSPTNSFSSSSFYSSPQLNKSLITNISLSLRPRKSNLVN